jgi:tetratricopeptide (TPR) repeat protein
VSELAEKYFEKALTAIRIRDYDRAAGLLVEAIKLKPDFTEAWVVRGNVLDALERSFDAILHYDRALGINDRLHDAWNNRGIAFANIGMWLSAEESFRKSAEILPALEPHMGLANMYCTLNRLEDAAAEYRAAISCGAGADARFNLGVTLLGLGKWSEGFDEYEYRWENTPYPPRAYRDYRKWCGEDLSHKRILLYGEQGYGDEIMALRFAETLAYRYPLSYVMVQARSPMLRLAGEMQTINLRVVDGHGNWQADYSCPLLEVPMVLGLTHNDVAASPYLSAPYAADRALYDWRDRLDLLPPGLNVGLCWSSGGHLDTARAARLAKSIPLQWLKPLAMPGVNLISLQKPQESLGDMPITDWMDECHDFADTAALIEELDLVISVDTAVAHLAGAMGRPVWNFVRYSGYWPWCTADVVGNPEKAIWYPSMKLLRQPSLANWAEPIERATRWLTAETQKRAAA